jgi:hypothetical protein
MSIPVGCVSFTHCIVNKIQDTGYRIQDTGYRIQDAGYRIQDAGYRMKKKNENGRWSITF